MKVKIFTSGCATCGVKALYVARVRNIHNNVEVINTRAFPQHIKEHLEFQKNAGMGNFPIDIVVENEGSRIIELKDYK